MSAESQGDGPSDADADASASVSGGRAEAFLVVGATIAYTVYGSALAGVEAGPTDKGTASPASAGRFESAGVAICRSTALGSTFESGTCSTTPAWVA